MDFPRNTFWKKHAYLLEAGLIFALAAILRLWGAGTLGLWYDELQSVTYAHLPVRELFPNLRELDPHPFFYYLQLHFWMQAGTSDLWLRYNSAFWSLALVASILITCRSIFSEKVALIAAAFFAVSPIAEFYGQQVRMYALMMFLAFWVWFFTHLFFHNPRKLIPGAGLVLFSLSFLYTHGSAFLIFASTFSFALLTLYLHRQWKKFFWWLALQGLIIAGYIPWLIHAETINVSHTVAPDFVEITRTMVIFLFGVTNQDPGLLYYLAWILIPISLLFLFFRKKEIVFVTSFLIAPLIACLILSYAIRPIWLTRTVSFVTPFLSISLALSAEELLAIRFPSRRKLIILPKFILALALGTSLAFLIYQKTNHQTVWELRGPVNFVRQTAGINDIVAIDNPRVYWGWCWYAIGPGCVDPIKGVESGIDQDGRLILSAQPFEKYLKAGRTVWYVYRNLDSQEFLPNLPDLKRDLVYDHLNVYIEKLQLPQPPP